MRIKDVSEADKKVYIARVVDTFNDLRGMLNTLEVDMVSTDLMVQASAVWIGGNLCTWYSDFLTQIRELDQKMKSMNELKDRIQDVVESNQPEDAVIN